MQKVRLQIDQLEVESFATVNNGSEGRGTVRARGYTEDPVWDCAVESASGPVRCVCGSDPRWGTCDSCNPDFTCNPDVC